MKTFAITGTIGSGKSTLSTLLRRRHLAVFDADAYGRMAFEKTNPCYARIVDHFSTAILDETGEIDTRRLADIVFSREEERQALDEIVHPFVKSGVETFLSRHENDLLVFAEIPLLFEVHWEDRFDEVIVVTCERETAIARLMRDRGYTRRQAEARLARQVDPETQIAKADVVFHNDGSIQDLDHALGAWLKSERSSRAAAD